MAYAARFRYDDPEKQNGTNISGASSGAAVGIPGQESSKPQKGSGQYANIQSYLEANKDQGDQMGQKIAGDVSQNAQTAQNKITEFQSKAPSVREYDPNEAYNNLGNLSTEQKETYRANKATGGYSGPQSLDQVEGYDDTQKAYNQANQKLEGIKSESGQQQLLRSTYERPQYSAGENKLDQVLLQNSPNSRSRLEELGQTYSGLGGLFSNAETNVGNAINTANATALKNKNKIQEAESNQWNSILNPIQQRADQANVENPVLSNRLYEDLLDNVLSEDTLNRLGLNVGTKLYNQNLINYFTPGQTQVGVDNVATAEERAKYQALADLVQDPTRTQITSTGKAIDPYTFDKAKFEADNAAKQAEMQNIFDNTVLGQDFGFDNFGWYVNGRADTNVGNYLRDPNQGSIQLSNQISGPGNTYGRAASNEARSDAMLGARTRLIDQIEKFLNDNNYYRTIQKG